MNELPDILYNITFRKEDRRTVLAPVIPESAADDENKTIKRICFSDSINHCISAIAGNERDMKIGTIIGVRSIRTKDLNQDFILTPQELFDKGYVIDAVENQEYWYIDSATCKLEEFIVESFDYEYDIAWSCLKTEDVIAIVKELMPSDYEIPVEALSSEDIYNAANGFADKNKIWNVVDSLWESIAKLPYAQHISFKDIKLKKTEDKIVSNKAINERCLCHRSKTSGS